MPAGGHQAASFHPAVTWGLQGWAGNDRAARRGWNLGCPPGPAPMPPQGHRPSKALSQGAKAATGQRSIPRPPRAGFRTSKASVAPPPCPPIGLAAPLVPPPTCASPQGVCGEGRPTPSVTRNTLSDWPSAPRAAPPPAPREAGSSCRLHCAQGARGAGLGCEGGCSTTEHSARGPATAALRPRSRGRLRQLCGGFRDTGRLRREAVSDLSFP